jgi:uncharacterized protein (DUF1330 family)
MSDLKAAPRPGVLEGLAGRHSGPVVIMNLLKFKADAGDGRTGRQAYADYGALAADILPIYGAEVVWTGRQQAIITGGPQDDWDVVLLVRYPSVDALARMSASPEYRAIYHHRTAALEREAVTALTEDFALGL